MFVWRKKVAINEVESWQERLEFIGERLAVIERSGAARPSLEVYFPARDPALALQSAFGGSVRPVTTADWQPPARLGPVLSIAGRLAITGRPEELEDLRTVGPALCIPAAMAFGTGEHATTAMCLRFLAEVARKHRKFPWELLDLGAGTGVLALAGRLMGAARAEGYDNDPHAVRTAKENARLNGVSGVRFRNLDLVRDWKPERTWPVITANLFSGLILTLLPQIKAALSPGGSLILSGTLREQAPEVATALGRLGLPHTLRRKGKWVALLATNKV